MNSIHQLPSIQSSSAAGVAAPATSLDSKRKRDRPGKQQALLQAALHLFAEKGYESATTREIASAASCAEGLIHRYFNGKSGLLAALVEQRVLQEVGDLSEEVGPAATIEEEVVQLVNWEVERKWQDRDFLRVFIRSAVVDPAAAELERAVLPLRSRIILERLQRYPSSTRFSKGELEALAESVGMLGFVFGFMRPLVLGQDRLRAKEMALRIAKLLVGAQ